MGRNIDFTAVYESKAAVTAAFKALRKDGLITRQGFMCCGGCASAQIANDIENAAKGVKEFRRKTKKFTPYQYINGHYVGGYTEKIETYFKPAPVRNYIGAIFYSSQSNDAWKEGYDLYINYGAVEDNDEANRAIGMMLYNALINEGLSVSWSGNPHEAVKVHVQMGSDTTRKTARANKIQRANAVRHFSNLPESELIALAKSLNLLPQKFDSWYGEIGWEMVRQNRSFSRAIVINEIVDLELGFAPGI